MLLRARAATETEGLVIRRAVDSDARAVAEVWLRSFPAALPDVRRTHTDERVRTWFRDVVVPGQETWVAAVEGSVVGLMVLDGDDLDQLSLDPPWRGRAPATASCIWPSGATPTDRPCGRSA